MSRRWTLVAVLVVLLSIPTTSGAQASCVDPPSGLQSWWPGDNNAADVFGAWNGTLVGDTTYEDGMVNAAFSFDGSGDYVEIADAEAGDFGSDPFTVAFWFKSDIDGNGTYLLGKSHPDGGQGWDFRLHDRRIQLEGVNGWAPQYNLQTDQVITTGQWHHIAVTSDGLTVTLYVDGSTDPVWTIQRQAITTASNPLRFGLTTNYGGTAFDGLMDEVVFFNRALNATEVRTVAHDFFSLCRPCAALPDSAIAWWRAEEGTTDEVGGLDGALGGDAGFTDGKVGRAFALDGAGDFVELPDSSIWDFGTGSFSVAAWINNVDSADPDKIVVWDNGAADMGIWGLFLDDSGIPHFQICDQSGYPNCYEIQGPEGLADGNWHFVAGVRDASGGNLHLWVDGVEVAAAVSDGGANVIGAANNRAMIGSGGWGGGGTFHGFQGTIDEVMVVGSAMTAAEIVALANADDAGVCVGCNFIPGGVSWWRAEDNASDAYLRNDGALFNGAIYDSGLVGQAFSFETTNAYVEVAHDESLSFGVTDPMTIELWAYRTGSHSTAQHLIGKRSGCGAQFNYQIVLDSLYNTGLCFATSDGTTDSVCSDGEMDDLPLNTWTHIAATFDGTTKRLYLNGVEVASGVATLGTPDEATVRIGTSGTCGEFGQEFRGLIDEAEIHDRALSLGDIKSICNAGAHGKCVLIVFSIIFSDGFEDGDTSAWTSDTNPT